MVRSYPHPVITNYTPDSPLCHRILTHELIDGQSVAFISISKYLEYFLPNGPKSPIANNAPDSMSTLIF